MAKIAERIEEIKANIADIGKKTLGLSLKFVPAPEVRKPTLLPMANDKKCGSYHLHVVCPTGFEITTGQIAFDYQTGGVFAVTITPTQLAIFDQLDPKDRY